MAYHKWQQGQYTPEYPEKYIGDPTKIWYRSSWELYFNDYVDHNPFVLKWASECIAIEYLHPFHNQIRRYYPDYYVKYVDKYGNIHEEIIEVKPKNQIILPKRPSKQQQMVYMINQAKWIACKRFCDKHGIKFKLLSEQQLFKQYDKSNKA